MKEFIDKSKIKVYNIEDSNDLSKDKIINEIIEGNKIYILLNKLEPKNILETIGKFSLKNCTILLKINTDNGIDKYKEFTNKNLNAGLYLYYENDKKLFEETIEKFLEEIIKDAEKESDTPIIVFPILNLVLREFGIKGIEILYEEDKKMLKFIKEYKSENLQNLIKVLLKND